MKPIIFFLTFVYAVIVTEGLMMRTLIKLSLFCFLLYITYSFFQEKFGTDTLPTAIEFVKTELNEESINSFIENLDSEMDTWKELFQSTQDLLPDWDEQEEMTPVEKPELTAPSDQLFSIYNVQIGDNKDEVEKHFGEPKRITLNEYGVSWNTYHKDYRNFIMISYNEEDKVVGLYSNQDLISSQNGISFGSSKETVLEILGTPLEQIRKGLIQYKLPEDRDYEMFLLENEYITIFFDKHQNNTVTAMQIVSASLEENRKDFYTKDSEELKEGFEFQLFDLTNASRVNNGLNILTWDDQVKDTARKHSLDMADNNYFSHTNLEGESPFDRMLEDGIKYTMAGENLAYGQYSSIFAHEGLMNSLGHRENILQSNYANLGVGVAFNEESQPYYTENFFRK